MATVSTGGYSLTTTGEDLSGATYKEPTVDPRLVRRLIKGNSSKGENAYIQSANSRLASNYVERSKLTKDEFQVKSLLDQGIGVLDEPTTDLTPEFTPKNQKYSLDQGASDIALVTEADPSLKTLSKEVVLKSIRGLIAKGYLYTI